MLYDCAPSLSATTFMSALPPSAKTPPNPQTDLGGTTFGYPDAEIILRSCDSQEFRVIKLYIIKSSPVLSKQIQAISDSPDPAISTDARSTLPVVQLPDSGTVLSALLTFIFPVRPILPSMIEETMELLSVAQKYEMDHVLDHIRGNVAQQYPPLIHKDNALNAYSLAQKHGLSQEVAHAARITLNSDLTIENLEGELDVMPGAHLFELWRYHQRVQANLLSTIGDFKVSNASSMIKGRNCTFLASFGIPKWIDDYISSMANTPSLFGLIQFQAALTRHIKIKSKQTKERCRSCACLPVQTIDEFWTALTTLFRANIEEAESAIFIFGGNPSSQDHVSSVAIIPLLPECLDLSDADIIIQSSDFASFRIHKSILISSSQFFRDMLSLPQPSNNEIVDGLPVVRLSEGADLVRALVTVLYPIPPELPASHEGVLALLSAAQKYDMITVQSSIRAEIIRRGLPAPIAAHTLRAYAIAFRNKLLPEIRTAARLTLDYPLTFEALGEELKLFDGPALRELATFRRVCRDSLISCLESFSDTRIGPSKIWVGCPTSVTTRLARFPDGSSISLEIPAGPPLTSTPSESGPPRHESRTPLWLRNFFMTQIEELKQYFTHALLNPLNIREKYLAALSEHCSNFMNNCQECSTVHVRNGEGYCVALEQTLTQARDQASNFDKI